MSDAIEQAAEIIGRYHLDDSEDAARALAAEGLLAPASQLRAFARLCVDGGDMTPAAARMLDRIIDGDWRAEK